VSPTPPGQAADPSGEPTTSSSTPVVKPRRAAMPEVPMRFMSARGTGSEAVLVSAAGIAGTGRSASAYVPTRTARGSRPGDSGDQVYELVDGGTAVAIGPVLGQDVFLQVDPTLRVGHALATPGGQVVDLRSRRVEGPRVSRGVWSPGLRGSPAGSATRPSGCSPRRARGGTPPSRHRSAAWRGGARWCGGSVSDPTTAACRTPTRSARGERTGRWGEQEDRDHAVGALLVLREVRPGAQHDLPHPGPLVALDLSRRDGDLLALGADRGLARGAEVADRE
jgi:hypothetical protein